MATRRSRIVVKPNLKPAVPKASAVAATQKTKAAVSTLQSSGDSANTIGKQAVTSLPLEKSTAAVAADTDRKKPSEKGTVDIHSTDDIDGNTEGGAIKQKLNAHLLKKNVVSNLTEEFAKEAEANDKASDESISLCPAEKEMTVVDNANAELEQREREFTSIDDESQKVMASEPCVVVSTAPPPPSQNDDDVPATNNCAAEKTDASIQDVEDDVNQVDTLTVLKKSGDVTDEIPEVTKEDDAPQPKPQRKKREKKERKEPLPPCDKSPDRHKMRIGDLIVWNPASNFYPKKKKTASNSVKKEERPKTPESVVSLDDESSNQSNSLPAPRVMIGPDGNIVLDTQSLIIETPKDDTEAKAVIEEDDDDRYLNSSSYRKQSKAKMWTDKENEKFFIGLSMCGTDFSLMCNLLPKRTRRELKSKFRREEKRNRFLIDKALSSRLPYDVTPFEKMAEEEAIQLKAAIKVKKEGKRKCKVEAKEERLKKVKKERRQAKKRKAKESEDEEDDWGEEPEYDDEEEENPSEENDDENDVNAATAAPTSKTKKRKMAEKKRPKESQLVSNNNSSNASAPRRVFTPIEEDVNQPFVPPGLAAPGIPSIIEEMVNDDETSTFFSDQQSRNVESSVSSVLPSADAQPPLSYQEYQTTTPSPRRVETEHTATRDSASHSNLPGRQTEAPSPSTGKSLGMSLGGISTSGLRSIPGTAPIQIEMEGVTTPMQGVLIPSHLVPQLAPQLGIPQSSTPMQVLLVQEEGGTGGNMVHVYVLPEKESTPFPQVGQGRVAADGSGLGLTLTSPIPSPHPPARRPSSSSTPTPASPFSPTAVGQNSSHPFPFKSPPQAPSSLSTPGHLSDSETSLSTIRNVYGTAMDSLTSTSTAASNDHSRSNTNTKSGVDFPSAGVVNSGRLTVLSSHHPPPQFSQHHIGANASSTTLNNKHNVISQVPVTSPLNHAPNNSSSVIINTDIHRKHLRHLPPQQQQQQQHHNSVSSAPLNPSSLVNPTTTDDIRIGHQSDNINIDSSLTTLTTTDLLVPPPILSDQRTFLADPVQLQQSADISTSTSTDKLLPSFPTSTPTTSQSTNFPKLKNLLSDSN